MTQVQTRKTAVDRARAAIRGLAAADALAHLDRAVADLPNNVALHYLRVEKLLAAGALEAAEAAAAAPPLAGTGQGHMAEARLFAARGKPGLAVIAARRALRRSPTRAAVLLLARCLAAAGDRDAAIAHLRDVVAAQGGIAFRQELAQLLIAAERPDEALRVTEAILAEQPGHKSAMLERAALLTQIGRDADAAAQYRAAIAAAPDDPRPPLAYARWRRAAGDPADALAVLEAAPDDTACRLLRLWVLMDLDRTEWAIDGAEALAEDGVDNPSAALQLARIAGRLNQRDLECDVLAGALAQGLTSPALTDHVLDRALPFLPPDRFETLYDRMAPATAARIAQRIAQRTGDFDTVLAQLRARQPRTSTAALDIYRALVGRFRFALALRYLRLARRRWPHSVTLLSASFTGRVRYGDLDGAAALLDAGQPESPAMAEKRRGLRLSLRLHRGEVLSRDEIDALLAAPIRDQAVCMTLLQHLILHGHYEAVVELTKLLREIGNLRQRVHWEVTPLGQQSTELFLTQDRYGAARLQEMRTAPEAELRAEVQAAPWSIVLARFLLLRHVRPERLPPLEGPEPHAIPKVIYQYWDRTPPPEAVQALSQSWQRQGYRHVFLNKAAALKLVRDAFEPEWLRSFRMAKRPAEEADLLRLCLLSKFGGIWADADDMLTGDLETLLAGVSDLALFHEPISGVITNNVMAARPDHPAMLYAAQSARDEILSRSNETIWAKTGPGLMARAIAHYIATQPGDGPVAALQMRDQSVLRRAVAVHNPLRHKSTERHWNAERIVDPGYGALIAQLFPPAPDPPA